jgi:hypothetical protein
VYLAPWLCRQSFSKWVRSHVHLIRKTQAEPVSTAAAASLKVLEDFRQEDFRQEDCEEDD